MIGGLSSVIAIALIMGAVALLGWLVGAALRGRFRQDARLALPGQGTRLRRSVRSGRAAGIAIAVVVGNQMGFQSQGRTIGLFCLAGFFLLLGLPLGLESFRKQVISSDDEIASRSWFGTLHHIRWSDVQSVSNEPISGYIRVCGAGVTVKVNHYLDGLDVFIAECKQRVEPRRYGNTFNAPISNPFAMIQLKRGGGPPGLPFIQPSSRLCGKMAGLFET